MPIIMPRRIRYEPVPVRVLLREMKDYASIMLDLAYYSMVYADEMMAYEVLKIENRMDWDWSSILMQLMMAARSPEDAEGLLSIARIATALDVVSDAAGDIANVTAQYSDHLSGIASALMSSEEVVARVEVKRLGVKHVSELVEYPRHADVIVIIRGHQWFIDPPENFELREGDKIIVRGTEEAIRSIMELVGSPVRPPILQSRVVDGTVKDVYRKVAWLKNIADVALDLAFHSVVYNDKSSAIEVLEIEELVDMKVYQLLQQALGIPGDKMDVADKIVLARFVESLEKITDAAAAMASVTAANLPVSEVIELAEEESNEIVLKTIVAREASGKTIEELMLDDIGAHVVAIKKKDRGWIPLPSSTERIGEGDVMILKLYSEKDERLIGELEKRGLIPQEE